MSPRPATARRPAPPSPPRRPPSTASWTSRHSAMTQISTFFGLHQSLRGLLAHQRAMDVTGHNITNANTQGYSRQEAVMAAATPYDIEAGLLVDGGGAMLGGGVDIQAFRRVRDGFLDLQFRAQSLQLGEHEARTN